MALSVSKFNIHATMSLEDIPSLYQLPLRAFGTEEAQIPWASKILCCDILVDKYDNSGRF
jgi:hypothetical protein